MSEVSALVVDSSQVPIAAMIAAKHAIALEQLGMKHSRICVRKRWAITLGLGEHAKHQDVIQELNRRIHAATHNG